VSDEPDLPEYVARNRASWDAWASEYVAAGERNWAADEPSWGIWGVTERELGVLPDDLTGRDAIELGCGTAYVGAWLARRGARVTGIDNSPVQLATARRLQAEHGLSFPLLLGNAERVPLPDASFDLAISEYGASIWADPYRWVPEAARLLRPGGELICMVNGAILMLCVPDAEGVPAGRQLLRDYFGMHRFEWPDDPSVEFHIGHGEWIRLLRRSGLEVTDLIEVRPPEGATTRYPFVTLEWARRWPAEEIWKARRPG
jgi:SAM-dependent methyltransferase